MQNSEKPSINTGGAVNEGKKLRMERKRKYNINDSKNLFDEVYERALEQSHALVEKRQRLHEIDGDKKIRKRPKTSDEAKADAQKAKFFALVGFNRLKNCGKNEPRMSVARLSHHPKFEKVSGGFRLYLRLMTDSVLNEICELVDDQGKRNSVKDMDLYLAQILRHAWCQLPEKERVKYEKVARNEFREICRTKKARLTDKEIEGSEKENHLIQSLPAMPLTEFPFMSVWIKEQKQDEQYHLKDKQTRCPICKYTYMKDDTLQMHILYAHHCFYVYACHFCCEGFTSLKQLKNHYCTEFAQYMLQLATHDLKFELKFAMHTLICAECNLQIPLSSINESTDNNRKRKLKCLLKYHNTDRLVSCIALFSVKPSEIEYVTIKSSAMKFGIPVNCTFCTHQFTSATDIEKHQITEHSGEVTKMKCPICPRFYVTDIFYRDHLLSHLGEANAMISILEKATFWPPAFSSETTPKMGPSLQKVIGSAVVDSSVLDKTDQITDDEDISYQKSLQKKKDGRLTRRKMKTDKKSNQDLCYYCKQVQQVSSEPVCRSTLCSCMKSGPIAPSLSVKNSLVNSLVEKFTREARLYVDLKDSIFDTTKGAIVDDSVFMCVKCKCLHLGEKNILKHLRICMQKEVESPDPEKCFDLKDSNVVSRLTRPGYLPNGRIHCPECEETMCSIISLRRHLALEHGTFTYYNVPDSQKAIGIMEYMPSSSHDNEKLGNVAVRINRELNLTTLGNFKQKGNKRTEQLPLNSPTTENANNSRLNVASSEISDQATPVILAARSAFSEALAEPSKNTAALDKSTCIVCYATFDSSQDSATHFINRHLCLCPDCNVGFINEEYIVSHRESCHKWPKKCNGGEFFPRCSICSFVFVNPKRFYYHLVHCHETSIKVDTKSHQIYPMFIWNKLCSSYAEKLKKLSWMETVATVEQSSVDDRTKVNPDFVSCSSSSKNVAGEENTICCVLCELPFPNQENYNTHLQKHPEQWNHCPVCRYFDDNSPSQTTDQLFKHLLGQHVDRSIQAKGMKLTCILCRSSCSSESTSALSVECCEDQMIRHILYYCTGIQMCFLCNDKVVHAPEALKRHRINEHGHIYERFGCSGCERRFHIFSSFKKHSCKLLLKCSCGDSSSLTQWEFSQHFKEHLNEMMDFCLLCNSYIFSKEQLTSHMVTHRTIVSRVKKLVLLNQLENLSQEPTENSIEFSNSVTKEKMNEKNGTTFRFGNIKIKVVDNDVQSSRTTGETGDQNNKDDGSDARSFNETVSADSREDVELESCVLAATVLSSSEHLEMCTAGVQNAFEADEVRKIIDEMISATVSKAACCHTTETVLQSQPATSAANVDLEATDSRNDASSSVQDGENYGNESEQLARGMETVQERTCVTEDQDSGDRVMIDNQTENNTNDIRGEEVANSTNEVEEGESVDEDLVIIETNEQQRTVKRVAKYCCDMCTEKFLTKASLLSHKETHRYDAGQTIEAVCGVPVNRIVYICRLCCLAYESREMHQVHMHSHGRLFSCESCSVVAFNESQMKCHQDQHGIVGEGRLTYICSICLVTFSSEERVYHHSFNLHRHAIIYFCKKCNLASTNGNIVYYHVLQNACTPQKPRSDREFKYLGFTSASIFHYQPVDLSEYEQKTLNNELIVVIPSECIHRSFLIHQDTISISCPKCNILMSFMQLQAENPQFTRNLPRSLGPSADDNESAMLALLNSWTMNYMNREVGGSGNQQFLSVTEPITTSCPCSLTALRFAPGCLFGNPVMSGEATTASLPSNVAAIPPRVLTLPETVAVPTIPANAFTDPSNFSTLPYNASMLSPHVATFLPSVVTHPSNITLPTTVLLPSAAIRPSVVPTLSSTAATSQYNIATSQSAVAASLSNVATSQSAANTRQYNVATSQSAANTRQYNVATSQSVAVTKQSNVATSQSVAVTRQSNVANSLSDVVESQTNVAGLPSSVSHPSNVVVSTTTASIPPASVAALISINTTRSSNVATMPSSAVARQSFDAAMSTAAARQSSIPTLPYIDVTQSTSVANLSSTTAMRRPSAIALPNIVATRRSNGVMLPSSRSSSGVTLPSSRSNGVTLPSSRSNGVTLPSSRLSGVTLPSSRSSGVTLPSSRSSGVTLPSNRSSGVTLPSSRSSGVTLPSSRSSSGVTLPSSRSSGVTLPSSRSSGVTLPSSRLSGMTLPPSRSDSVTLPSNRLSGMTLPSSRSYGVTLPSATIPLPSNCSTTAFSFTTASSTPPQLIAHSRQQETSEAASWLASSGQVQPERDFVSAVGPRTNVSSLQTSSRHQSARSPARAAARSSARTAARSSARASARSSARMSARSPARTSARSSTRASAEQLSATITETPLPAPAASKTNSHSSTSAAQVTSVRADEPGPSQTITSSRSPPNLQLYRGALEVVDLKTVATQMVTRDFIVKNAEGQFFCARSECSEMRIEKMSSGRVHNLRHNPQNIFFCLECGSSFPFENLMVKHMIECHHYKQVPVYCLRCPMCPNLPPFTQAELFKKHIAETRHEQEAAKYYFHFKNKCKVHFHTCEARMRHEEEHSLSKNLPCCFICGTSRSWWFFPAGVDFPYIDHSYIHAFSIWGMCRECGLCHPNELRNQQFLHHYREHHMTKWNDGWNCRICDRKIDESNIDTHALQRHFVIGVKTDRRKPYVIEASETLIRAFLGYPVEEDARI